MGSKPTRFAEQIITVGLILRFVEQWDVPDTFGLSHMIHCMCHRSTLGVTVNMDWIITVSL